MVRQKVTSLHIIPILISLSGGAMPFCQALANEKCPKAIYEAAESSLINARTDWASLFKHRQNFARCDDGGLGEDYSDAVVGLFARKWDQLGFFATLSKRNPSFQNWAFRHIDATASDEDLKNIMLHTCTCPADSKNKAMCRAIRQRAKSALTELEKINQ